MKTYAWIRLSWVVGAANGGAGAAPAPGLDYRVRRALVPGGRGDGRGDPRPDEGRVQVREYGRQKERGEGPSSEQLEKAIKDLERDDFRQPIVVDEDGVIIGWRHPL
jgi:hypothetical protein